MKKYYNLIIIALLISSVSINFYLIFKTTPQEEAKAETYDPYASLSERLRELESNNPIDAFFDQEVYPKTGTSTMVRNYNCYIYSGAWQSEMADAYSKLLGVAHKDLAEYIISSQEHFELFCEAETEVAGATYSDGYGDELGEYGETISYGSGARAFGVYTVAKLYKQRTFELFSYLADIGEDITFVFDKEVFLDENEGLRKLIED